MRVCPICSQPCEMTPVGMSTENTGLPGWRCGTWGLETNSDTVKDGFAYRSGIQFVKITGRERFEIFMRGPETIKGRSINPMMVVGYDNAP